MCDANVLKHQFSNLLAYLYCFEVITLCENYAFFIEMLYICVKRNKSNLSFTASLCSFILETAVIYTYCLVWILCLAKNCTQIHKCHDSTINRSNNMLIIKMIHWIGKWIVGLQYIYIFVPPRQGISQFMILSQFFVMFVFLFCKLFDHYSQNSFPIIKTKPFKLTKYKKVWQIFMPKWVKIKIFVIILSLWLKKLHITQKIHITNIHKIK